MTSQSLSWTANAESFTSCAGTIYDSWSYHHGGGGAPNKAVWAVTRQVEADLFCDAEAATWSDVDGDLWGVSLAAETLLGSRGERFARFKPPADANSGWHGFPITNNPKLVDKAMLRQIPDAVIALWESSGQIDFVVRTRIARRKL